MTEKNEKTRDYYDINCAENEKIKRMRLLVSTF